MEKPVPEFRFWSESSGMIADQGWAECIGINEALNCSNKIGYRIMQFTGFFDKKRNKIFEADIVTFLYKNPNMPFEKRKLVKCEIVWNKLGMWSLKWKDGYINNGPLNPDKYEVIGNMCQHSNLMNSEK
jgi:hypothetical protein